MQENDAYFSAGHETARIPGQPLQLKKIRLADYLQLLRPKEWIKNTFLFIPLFFAGEFSHLNKIIDLCIGFVSFSLVASAIYIINDYRDIESDKSHPTKCLRPLAAGTIPKITALCIMFVILSVGFYIAYTLKAKFLFLLSLYFLVNLFYSFGLKNISILDILIVSSGFVFRIKSGGAITSINVTTWLVIMVFLLALFMSIAKRRDDVLIKLQSGIDIRKAIKGYNLEFLNFSLILITSVTLVAYLMYTVSPEVLLRHNNYRLYYTCIFVIAGIMRYLQLTFVENSTASPTRILYKDRFIQLTILLWIISFCFIIYMPENFKFFND